MRRDRLARDVMTRRHQRHQSGRPARWASDEPWRLLTTELAGASRMPSAACGIVQADARRRQVECVFCFGKGELGVESIRVRGWERQAKLLALPNMAYGFLAWLLRAQPPERSDLAGVSATGALAALLAAALPPPLARHCAR